MVPEPPPTPSVAARKLEAAEVLVERHCIAEAFPLLVDACLHALAERLETPPPPPTEAATWLLTRELPSADAQAVLRALALAAAPSVPDALVAATLDDTRRLVAR